MSWAAKRFWTQTEIEETAAGYCITLDGRPVKTPSKALLAVPTLALAQAIQEEWDAQTGEINPETMPFTRAANSALDKVTLQFHQVAEMLAEYGGSDLLCYRAEGPEGLIERQERAWDPLLKWVDDTYGIPLSVTSGIMPVRQSQESMKKITDLVKSYDPFELTAFHEFVTLSGSLVIGLAVMAEHETLEALWDASRIDEIWQNEQWGVDDEAKFMSEQKRLSFHKAANFLAKLK